MSAAGPVLSLRGVSRRFGGFHAVSDVSLEVPEGQIHALIGPNGAGKTTLFNLISGALPVSEGHILYQGQDITGWSEPQIARAGMVRSFQISAIFPRITVRENLRIALARPSGITNRILTSDRRMAQFDPRADELIEAVGLSDVADHTAGGLPYGRKRALELATTLALDPQVMLLDEPMAGLGHEDVERISNLIAQVAQGRTVLMVEHNLAVVAQLAHTLTVLARGEVLAEGTYDAIRANPAVITAYIGEDVDA